MQIKLSNTKYALLGLSACMLASCSLSSIFAETTEKNIDSAVTSADTVMNKAAVPNNPLTIDTVRVKSEIWLGNSSAKMPDGEPLPARFETENAVTLVGNREVNLFEIAERITALTGLLVRIDDLLLDNGGESSSGSENAAAISYSGKLSGLLDQVSSRFGIWWKYKAGVITFYEMETRTFTVYALPTESSVASSVSNSGSSEGGTGSSTSSIEYSAAMKTWDQITETVKNMLPSAAKMSVSSSNGIITVTAPPDTLRKVGKYVRDINDKMSRQVAITVRVLQVALDKTHQYGLDLDVVFKNSHLDLGLQSPEAFGTAWAAKGSAQGLSFKILGNGSFADTQGILKALSTQGDASLVTTATVTTMNNKSAPVQIAKNQDYISKTETTLNGDNSTSSAETETLNLGFNMNVLPRILDHGRLMMFFTMTLNDLLDMQEVKIGETTMMLPSTETRGFSQEVILRSGSTLVIAGFEQMRNSIDKKGLGSVDNPIGGGFNSEDNRAVLVILITPEVLVSPLSPETRVTDM